MYVCGYINIELKTLNTKGPRIKHVCRNADFVMGQIPATFENDDKTEVVYDNKSKYFKSYFLVYIYTLFN